jgi:hypothetical protein
MSANTPLQLANALRSYPHFCGETCPLCNAAAELERARGAVTPGDLIKATSSGMAIIFTHVGPYTTLTPYMKGKWDELSALHAKANKALTASPPGGFSDFIRNASPEEKERVYQGVMERAAERQKAVTDGLPEEPPVYPDGLGRPTVDHADYDLLRAKAQELVKAEKNLTTLLSATNRELESAESALAAALEREKEGAALSERVWVPREPTEEMVTAYLDAQREFALNSDAAFGVSDPRRNFRAGYKAMLAAAPGGGDSLELDGKERG